MDFTRAHEPVAVVRRGGVKLGTERDDAGRIYLALARVVMPLDVIDAHGLVDARHLIEVTEIVRQILVIADAPQIALEVAVIDRVEANERGEQPPVGLGHARAGDVALPREPPLDIVERREHVAERLLVGGLRGGEAGAIDAVVDVRIDQLVDGVDLAPQLRRIMVGALVGERVERRVQHPDDLGGFVADDRLPCLVPKHRH